MCLWLVGCLLFECCGLWWLVCLLVGVWLKLCADLVVGDFGVADAGVV